MMYKRFMVFTCPEFYPSGGLSDCIGSFDDEIDALEFAVIEGSIDGWMIFDRVDGIVIKQS